MTSGRLAIDRPLCLGLLGAVVLTPILLAALVAIPWLGRISELDDAIADSVDQLRRYQRLVGTLPVLQAELERVRTNDTFDAFYFKAQTQALAGAQLQTQIQEIVTTAAGRLISTQILPTEGRETPARIRVRTQIQGSTETLMELLYRLEQARPFLFVERLSVRSSARPADTPKPGPVRRHLVSNQGGELMVRLDIYGFVLDEGAQ